MFTGINYFRDLALYYEKHECYPYDDEYREIYNELNPPNSKTKIPVPFDALPYYMQDFAKEQIMRFVNGDSHGDTKLTGEHSLYLNVVQIDRTVINSPGIHKNNPLHSRKVGRRVSAFPDFWDEDWRYFWACDIARFGLETGKELERYKELCRPCSLDLVETVDNLSGGLDIFWLKPRGVGASWKGGAKANYNQFLVPDSNTFIMAETEPYLIGDGIFDKFNKIRSFIQGKCWFLSKQFYKESLSEFEYSTGLKKNVGGGTITEGFSSTVSGLIIDAKPGKARGKRGDILFEESGSFPSMDDVWNVTEASVNEYGVIYGQRRAFGTGGDKGGNFEFMEKAMADPAAYRLIQCNNPYDEFEKPISFFTNCYTNITDKDENGNSLKDVAKQKFDKIEAELQKGEDITRLDKHKAEYPRKPSDAFRKITGSILPGALAANRLELLKKSNIDRKICSYGWLKTIGKDIQFFPDDVIPFEQYPIKNDGNSKKGCISIFQEPYRVRGIVPADLYTIHVDAYTQDEAESGSIGSVYVYEQPNRYTRYKGDICPAWYNARPEGFNGSDEFAKNVFLLAEFYNAQIALENDQVGELVSYAKKHTDSKGRKLTLYLADQFEIGFNEDIVTKAKMKRAFGMNMTEGRKKQGLKYFQEWLVTPRGQNEDGVTIYNIDLIYDRGLLEEIKKYEYGKNADRISSWLIGMYHIREIEYQESKRSKSQRNSLQDLQLF